MGAQLYTSFGDWMWPIDQHEPDPPPCVFPHACPKHVAIGYVDKCEACQVCRWYQQQQKHIRAMAVARIREVTMDSGCESKLSMNMQNVAAVLTEKIPSEQR